MENNVKFNYFENDIIERVIAFQSQEDSLKTKESIEALKQEIKSLYHEKDEALLQ